MSTSSNIKTFENCPNCGKPVRVGEACCGFSAESQDEIPLLAEVHVGDIKIPITSRWLRIGRDDGNQIVIREDYFASRYHAWVTYEQNCFWVEDLGSTNGTLLNGQLLDRREALASGDKIKIGETEMTFVLLEKVGRSS